MTVETPEISVVVPVHDEAGAAVPLAREIAAAFAGRSYEMIFVDDASKDATLAELKAAMAELPALRVLAHGANAGQSRAVRTGVLAARAPVVVTMDGDGQNPPADAPRLVDALPGRPRRRGPGRRVVAPSARTPRPSARPRSGPTASAANCWATTPTTPAAG
jgi:dolichol-phosphate mannosyltransferase